VPVTRGQVSRPGPGRADLDGDRHGTPLKVGTVSEPAGTPGRARVGSTWPPICCKKGVPKKKYDVNNLTSRVV
jgi:hypothetical protein